MPDLVPRYGDKKPNPVGIGVAILVHLIIVLVYLLQPHTEKHAPPPAGGAITYVMPLQNKAKPPQQAQPKQSAKPKPQKPTRTAPVQVQRLPNTITLPKEKPVEVVKEEPKPPVKEVPQEVDLSAYIEARRKARGAAAPSDAVEESESERGNRIAKANIAAANGRSRGADDNDSGGVFQVINKTSLTAEVKFRGWNKNFQRRWLKQVPVELGKEPDIETAIVKKMIELIRLEKDGDFEWESHRLQRTVKMSARPKDQKELEDFLFQEMFQGYKRPR
ncbi:MAG: hypothetical protein ABIT83_05580 [Massilia sp.]